MALTRKMLGAMGIEDDKADQIIEAHAETVDALRPWIRVFLRSKQRVGQGIPPPHLRFSGRGDWIRTSDPLLPKQMRYQAALRPERCEV